MKCVVCALYHSECKGIEHVAVVAGDVGACTSRLATLDYTELFPMSASQSIFVFTFNERIHSISSSTRRYVTLSYMCIQCFVLCCTFLCTLLHIVQNRREKGRQMAFNFIISSVESWKLKMSRSSLRYSGFSAAVTKTDCCCAIHLSATCADDTLCVAAMPLTTTLPRTSTPSNPPSGEYA